MSNGISFAKDYQKDSHNIKNAIEKTTNDNNILATLKTHSYFLKIGILKL
jgi:hypothetical protein